ncbi:MAG: hypothetical protein RIA63_06715, partial [Cyclobacteriaceae bacterium]
MKRILPYCFIAISLLCFSTGWSQSVPPLERKTSISFQGMPIDVALSKLSQEGKFTFSYSPSILNSNHTVSSDYSDKSVREILNGLLGESILAKGRGNYIILTKAAPPTRKEVVKNTITVSGYVTNGTTGDKVAEVSVYDKKSLTGVITDQFGFFSIALDNPDQEAVLHFSKRQFMDTLISLNSGATQFINMIITPESLPVVAVTPVIDTLQIVSLPSLPEPKDED